MASLRDTSSAPGLAFQTLLREAKPTPLRKLIGSSTVEVLEGLDPNLVAGDRLGELASKLIDPSEVLRDPQATDEVKTGAAVVLLATGANSTIAQRTLSAAFVSDDAAVREEAAASIGRAWLVRDVSLPLLLRALDDPAPRVRAASSHSMELLRLALRGDAGDARRKQSRFSSSRSRPSFGERVPDAFRRGCLSPRCRSPDRRAPFCLP